MDKWFSEERIAALNLKPVEYELCASLSWLTNLRWIAAVGVIGATWLVKIVLGLGIATLPLTLIGISILVYNTLFWWWLSRIQCDISGSSSTPRIVTWLQISIDWIAMILLIHYSGGIESPAILYFLLHTTLAAIFLTTKETIIAATTASILMIGLTFLEYFNFIPHIGIEGFLPSSLHQNLNYILGILSFFISTMFVTAYLVTRTTLRLHQRESEMLRLGQELHQSYQRMRTLYDSGQDVNSTLELQEVLDRLTQSTTEVMGIKGCTIRLLQETGTTLCLVSTYGLSEDYLQKGCLFVDQNPLVREVLSGKIVAVGDIASENRLQFPLEARAEGIKSTLTAPLVGRDGPLGIIRVYCDKTLCFSEEDKQFLNTVASQGSIAIQNAMAYEAVQSLEEAKRKFILMITHDLRSPVGVIRSLLRTLSGGYAGELSTLQLDMTNRALRRANFLQTLIDDLLDLAAQKTGLRLQKDREMVNLSDVLENLIERYTVPAEEKHIQLFYHQNGTQPLMVKATTADLDRAITNIISNAIKYTPDGGDINIRLQQNAANAELTIKDSGIGIPEDALPHLFEEFYRAPNARAQIKEGTGLGLIISKDIITGYGGTIRVSSRENSGTTFTIILPLAST
jgi:signal transduction histidine kinase